MLVNFRIPVALKERLEMMADKQDQTLTAFVQKTFRFVAFMDPPFWPAIEHLADIYGLSESHIIQGIVARYLAESEAYKEMHGDAPHMMTEFSRMQSGAPLPMEELIKRLKYEFIRDARVEELLKKPLEELLIDAVINLTDSVNELKNQVILLQNKLQGQKEDLKDAKI